MAGINSSTFYDGEIAEVIVYNSIPSTWLARTLSVRHYLTDRYGAFTYLNASDPFFSSVDVLLHMEGTDDATSFSDSSSNTRTITQAGNAHVDHGRAKFGSSAVLLDGTGDYLSVPAGAAFGTGDFCIEAWVYQTNHSALQALFTGYNYNAAGTWRLYSWTDSTLRWYAPASGGTTPGVRITGSSNAPLNEWYHIAIATISSTTTMYLNGTSIGSSAVGNHSSGDPITIGGATGTYSGYGVVGSMDEFRITRGNGRYTSNFVVPTEAFPDS